VENKTSKKNTIGKTEPKGLKIATILPISANQRWNSLKTCFAEYQTKGYQHNTASKFLGQVNPLDNWV